MKKKSYLRKFYVNFGNLQEIKKNSDKSSIKLLKFYIKLIKILSQLSRKLKKNCIIILKLFKIHWIVFIIIIIIFTITPNVRLVRGCTIALEWLDFLHLVCLDTQGTIFSRIQTYIKVRQSACVFDYTFLVE